MNSNKNTVTTRDISIDRFRGFIVFCMIFFIAAGDFPCLGLISRFANSSRIGPLMLFKGASLSDVMSPVFYACKKGIDYGMSLADLVDPIFLYIISISYKPSFDRRFEKAGNKAYLHFIVRYLSFMGVGSIMVSAEYLLITGEKDPYFIQTMLMFAVFALLLLMLIFKLIPKCEKAAKLASEACAACLLIMGVMGIALGIRDDILIFSNSANINYYKHWSILHEIGMTGLLVLPFIRLSNRGKIISWCVLTAAYTAFQMLPTIVHKFDIVVLGGAIGTVGWLIIMLGSVILMTMFRKESKRDFIITLCVLSVITAAACIFLPMNTSAVTVNYVLFSLLCASAVFGALNLFGKKELKLDLFRWWGENPLLLFLIGIILRGFEKMWNPPEDTPFVIAFIAVFGSTALLTFLAYYLHKKKIHFRF